ncbi:MAG: T9SS type A sorting domain-containing protein [Bacteroidetes bacterium]|nr:T9SS type A sorting domain-containing protein [Bacteroidota bacterium]
MKLICAFIIIFLFPIISWSQTVIQGGNISGTWSHANSPYLIEGDIKITSSDTLNIEPGVVIEFQDYYGLYVEGYIHAIGNETDSILFTVNDTTGYHNYSHPGWKGIRFVNATPYDSSYIEYCIIEYGKGEYDNGGGMIIHLYDKLRITNSTIQYCFIDGDFFEDGGGGIAIFSSCIYIRDLTVKENHSEYNGGGVFIATSEIDAKRVTICSNSAKNKGGGLHSIYGSESLFEFEIINNMAGSGGGISSDSELHLIDSEVHENYATKGGGIYFEGQIEIDNTNISNNDAIDGGGIYAKSESHIDSKIINSHIYNNNSEASGGGIYISSSCYTLLQNSTIDSNYAKYGGGIEIKSSHAKYEGSTIKNNYADYGGGICIGSYYPLTINMDSVNLCNIYSNNGKVGKDLFSRVSGIQIIVDTFSAQNPSDYYALPAKYFTFNIANGLQNLINEDFYIAPYGSDQNSGLTNNDPFKTVDHALSILYTDEQNPATIFIEDGIYSPSSTGELFPLTILDNLSIVGSSNTILDAENTDRVLFSYVGSNQFLTNLILQNGNTDQRGGGISLQYSNAQLDSISIFNCNADFGGGLSTSYSNSEFSNLVLMNNTAETSGGGMWINVYECQVSLNKVTISNNTAKKGGGISINGYPYFINVSIHENSAEEKGGGIYNFDGGVIFDTTYLSNIYLNTAPVGNDLYNDRDSIIHIVVDTFTVINPTSYYANPLNLYTFDIKNGLVYQISDDIYVSPDGDDNNSGISLSEPIKTIKHGFSIASSNESNPINMHLASGVYSEATNLESFPIRPIDYLNIIGHDLVIIDADSIASTFEIIDLRNVKLENLQLQKGYAKYGGGINIEDSEVELYKLNITNNISTHHAGAIYAENTQLRLSDLVVNNNKSFKYQGAIMVTESSVDISNSIIDRNQALGTGGITASFSEINIIGSQITNNFDESSTGGLSLYYTNANIINSTFSNNTTNEYWSGSILAYDSVALSIKNCIFWDETNQWDIFARGDDYTSSVDISYSSLTNGEASIGLQGDVELKYADSNISGNPIFMDAGPFPFQISEYSPCIDNGTPDTLGLNLPPYDIAENPRIYNNLIDIGAYEWGPTVNIENHDFTKTIIDITIFPNPTNKFLTISYINDNKINQISIYNQIGQQIFNNVGATNKIDVSNIPSGLYIIEVVTNETKAREKLIINK